jgi:hypothetical protein
MAFKNNSWSQCKKQNMKLSFISLLLKAYFACIYY